MSDKKSDSQKYVEDFMRWQDNQYSPGAYTGGNFPLPIKYGGKKFGYFVLVQGVVILLAGLLIFFETRILAVGIVFSIFGLIFSYAGWSKAKRHSKRK